MPLSIRLRVCFVLMVDGLMRFVLDCSNLIVEFVFSEHLHIFGLLLVGIVLGNYLGCLTLTLYCFELVVCCVCLCVGGYCVAFRFF